ncbi:protein pellino isoform X2 [Folsomia candida]|uniref:protein pellino isoform X2 n=1 Tax=Folsomia candida TaxID=158441 RepID=UPI000B8FCC82|nr:protein pellino isoform X2 [Folsomia candida]
MGQLDGDGRSKEDVTSGSGPSVGSPTSDPVKYGELVVLGYNGFLPQGDKGRRRSKFPFFRREKPTGIKRSRHYVVDTPQHSKAVLDAQVHSISYTLSRNQAVVVEYVPDEDTDMFQIGRSSEMPIDFVVMDTVPGDKSGSVDKTMQSTISRFACRILVDRKPPHATRLFAAGFDSSRNIFLGEKATKWEENGVIDGLTTNGVLLLHVKGNFVDGGAKPLPWREVSVNGGLYTMRESRSAPQKGKKMDMESCILEDGSMIDLCGVTLLWRSAEGLEKSPSRRELETLLDLVNAGRPQCPVGLNTLVVGRKTNSLDREPYIYLKCGHVQGLHEWNPGQKKGTESKERTCPICMTIGPFVALTMAFESACYCDTGALTHAFAPQAVGMFAFVPCGHMVTAKTANYWANIPIPHGTKGYLAECPFCATPLEGSTGFVRLIFQDWIS